MEKGGKREETRRRKEEEEEKSDNTNNSHLKRKAEDVIPPLQPSHPLSSQSSIHFHRDSNNNNEYIEKTFFLLFDRIQSFCFLN